MKIAAEKGKMRAVPYDCVCMTSKYTHSHFIGYIFADSTLECVSLYVRPCVCVHACVYVFTCTILLSPYFILVM